ncbi:MAG: hypothetical protein IPN85_09875 [Flavobacteriales bacterium]|nr:hypothetical protein [Flavobacteriales bacterium]MBK9288910.1 hypothetical protein [Flavobacteriales bacterium]
MRPITPSIQKPTWSDLFVRYVLVPVVLVVGVYGLVMYAGAGVGGSTHHVPLPDSTRSL